MAEDNHKLIVKEPQVQFKVDTEARYVLVLSEPYLVFNRWGYAPAIDVFEKKTEFEFTMYISASTLAKQLEELRINNNDRFVGLEFWIRKETEAKNSKYILE